MIMINKFISNIIKSDATYDISNIVFCLAIYTKQA